LNVQKPNLLLCFYPQKAAGYTILDFRF